jgi:hypothetical protein
MTGRTLGLAAAAFVLALSPACLYTAGRGSLGPELSDEAIARIVPGASTKAEVLALLGPPNEYKRPELDAVLRDDSARLAAALAVAHRQQDVFTWQRDEVEFGGTWLLLFNRVDARTDSDLLVVFFDEHDVVRDVALRRSEL